MVQMICRVGSKRLGKESQTKLVLKTCFTERRNYKFFIYTNNKLLVGVESRKINRDFRYAFIEL